MRSRHLFVSYLFVISLFVYSLFIRHLFVKKKLFWSPPGIMNSGPKNWPNVNSEWVFSEYIGNGCSLRFQFFLVVIVSEITGCDPAQFIFWPIWPFVTSFDPEDID